MGTYVNNLRLLEIATGSEDGTWGTKTNTNLELIADAFGSGTEAITTNADTHTTTIADGSADEGRAIFLKYTGTLDSACTITLAPNTVNKLWFIENATSGSQNIIISQGSGANITIGNGNVAAVYTDGAGSGAAVLDAFADLELSSTLTVAGNVDFNGDLDVDGTTNLDAVDIDGAVQIDSTVTVGVNDTGYDVKFFGATSGAYMLWDESADDLVLAGAAKLGVGTTSPEELLDVASTSTDKGIQVSCYSTTQGSAGTIRLAHSLSGTVGSHTAVTVNDQLGRIFFAGSDGTDFYDGAAIIADSTQNYTGSNGGTRLEFWTTPTNTQSIARAMTIEQDGSVGIGIASPEALLHVYSGTDISMSSTGDGQIKIGGNAYKGAIALDGSNMNIYHNSSSRGLVLGTNETARLTIAGGGDVTIAEDLFCSSNVGIGTTSPGRMLELKESSTAAGDAVIRLRGNGNNADNTVLGALEWYNADSSGAGVVARVEAVSGNPNGHMGELVFQTNDGSSTSEAMRIDKAGDVGVGTASPAVKLHVEDSVEEIVRVKGSGNTGAVYVDADGGGSSGRGGMVVAQQNSSTCGVFGVTGAYRGNTNADIGIFAESGRRIEFAVNGSGSPVMVVHSGGNIGMGTITPSEKLDVVGNATISGSLSKGSGSFKIDHPLPAMSDTHHLVHSFVEGPKADLIYRGSVSLVGGAATVDLDAAATMTSGTWEVLCRDPQVWVQNEDGWTQVRGSISGSTLSIEAQDADCTDTVSWLVVAERKDPNIVGASLTDEEGRVIVEPLKTVEE